jgi:hypothetical protein
MNPQLLELVNQAASGKRPHFFGDADVDRLLAIVWAMAAELAVTRERLDTLERLLAERALVQRADIDAYRPDAQAARERGEWQMEYVARLLRVLQQELDTLRAAAGKSGAGPAARD